MINLLAGEGGSGGLFFVRDHIIAGWSLRMNGSVTEGFRPFPYIKKLRSINCLRARWPSKKMPTELSNFLNHTLLGDLLPARYPILNRHCVSSQHFWGSRLNLGTDSYVDKCISEEYTQTNSTRIWTELAEYNFWIKIKRVPNQSVLPQLWVNSRTDFGL